MPAAEVENSTATADSWLRPSNDKSPKLEIEMTDYGFQYAALRKPIKNDKIVGGEGNGDSNEYQINLLLRKSNLLFQSSRNELFAASSFGFVNNITG